MAGGSDGANLLVWWVDTVFAADKMRGHMDAAEYKHVALGLIFLKYISDAFQERFDALRDELPAVADARLDVAGVDQPTHVESESHDCEPRGHGQDCALCQYARSMGLPERPAAPLLISDRSARTETAGLVSELRSRRQRPVRSPVRARMKPTRLS